MQTAYVEAITTEDSHRNKGFAKAVMKKVTQEIYEFDLGALSPTESELYDRLGWQMWRGPLFIRTSEGLIATPSKRVMVLLLPKTPPLDLDLLLSAEWRTGELW